MTSTPKSSHDDNLGESWVDLSEQNPDRVTPLPFGSLHNGDMQKLLWEAQRDSTQSSARVSGASTRRGSPKSPPNSPNTELSSVEDLKDVYINCSKQDDLLALDRNTDWVWDWSSRPDQQPPKEWKFRHPRKVCLSMRHSKAMKCGLFSAEVFSILMLTNLVSILLGAGLGFYVGKRLGTVAASLD